MGSKGGKGPKRKSGIKSPTKLSVRLTSVYHTLYSPRSDTGGSIFSTLSSALLRIREIHIWSLLGLKWENAEGRRRWKPLTKGLLGLKASISSPQLRGQQLVGKLNRLIAITRMECWENKDSSSWVVYIISGWREWTISLSRRASKVNLGTDQAQVSGRTNIHTLWRSLHGLAENRFIVPCF
jgi:hypothetical protein